MVTRSDVTACLVFLIFVMITMNCYTLLIFWKTKLDKDFDDRRKDHINQLIKSKTTVETPSYDYEDPPTDPYDDNGVTSVRFVVYSDGSIRLIVPKSLGRKEIQMLERSILESMKRTEPGVANQSNFGRIIVNRIRRGLGGQGVNRPEEAVVLWEKLSKWPHIGDVISDGSLGRILSLLQTVKIMQVTGSKRGTQLKLEFLLEGGAIALFKPAWYPRDARLSGDPYGYKDRHFGEIAAFYLAQILGYRSGPIVVGRKLNLVKEIVPYSTVQLKSTFFRNNDGNFCFYGYCYYCKKEDAVCGDSKNEIEGALVVHMKAKRKMISNPWHRTYKPNQFAPWERSMEYCQSVLINMDPNDRTELLLDIVAASAFDFLIGNGDRHHLDVFTTSTPLPGHLRRLVLLDNGKSFGDSQQDYFDILAPLYQCCIIRKDLWETLNKFKEILGKSLDSVTEFDPLYPLLTQDHLKALDRRLNILISTIKYCLNRSESTLRNVFL